MDKLKIHIPLGLALIAMFYMAGAVILLIFAWTSPAQAASLIARAHRLPASTGAWILPLVAVLALIIGYGLFSRSRWGYGLAIAYLVYLGIANAIMLRTEPSWLHSGNLVWSVVVIFYLLLVRKNLQAREASTVTR